MKQYGFCLCRTHILTLRKVEKMKILKIKELLDAGDWQIFVGHGYKKDLRIEKDNA